MIINWAALLIVFAVSLSATVAVAGFVSLAVLGLSARAARAAGPRVAASLSPSAGTVVAGVGLAAAAVIVFFGLWAIVTR